LGELPPFLELLPELLFELKILQDFFVSLFDFLVDQSVSLKLDMFTLQLRLLDLHVEVSGSCEQESKE
jgi:hypothetical protein